jgi:hypothetical protein
MGNKSNTMVSDCFSTILQFLEGDTEKDTVASI